MRRIRSLKKTTAAPPTATPPIKGAIKMEGGNLVTSLGEPAAAGIWVTVVTS